MEAVKIGRLGVIWSLLKSPTYLAIMTAGALLYFLIVYRLIIASNYGIFLVTVPIYLVYIMVASAGLLLSLAVFSIKTALVGRASSVSEGAFSAILPTVGGLVATCACSYSVLAALLAFFGINAFEISGIVSGIALYQLWLIVAIVIINLLMVFYYSGKVAAAECKLDWRKRKALAG
jgi:hypothetical protein